jgi:hypothetical protein
MHFGQVGGGIFLGMDAHLGSGGSVTELSVTDGCLRSGGDKETLSPCALESIKIQIKQQGASAQSWLQELQRAHTGSRSDLKSVPIESNQRDRIRSTGLSVSPKL